MSQQDVIVSLEGSGKLAVKSMLMDLCKDGGAIDLEIKELDSQMPFGIGGIVGMAAKKLLQSIADKI